MAKHAEARMREYHKALIRVFREAIDLQKAIMKQIVKDIYSVYIKTIRESNTNTIQANLPMVLAYLLTIYGTIESEVLRESKLKV